MMITRTEIDEYWENAPQRIFDFYTRMKNEFGWKEQEVLWGIRNKVIEQSRLHSLMAKQLFRNQ